MSSLFWMDFMTLVSPLVWPFLLDWVCWAQISRALTGTWLHPEQHRTCLKINLKASTLWKRPTQLLGSDTTKVRTRDSESCTPTQGGEDVICMHADRRKERETCWTATSQSAPEGLQILRSSKEDYRRINARPQSLYKETFLNFLNHQAKLNFF